MSLTETSIKRSTDPTGDNVKTFQDASNRHVQAVGISDEAGDHAGIEANPIVQRHKRFTWVGTGSSLEISKVAKSSPGTLYEVRAILDPGVASARYLHVFDRTAVPTGGETPVYRALIPEGGEASDSLPGGLEFSTGIVVAVSTTLTTFTAPGSGEAVFHVGLN